MCKWLEFFQNRVSRLSLVVMMLWVPSAWSGMAHPSEQSNLTLVPQLMADPAMSVALTDSRAAYALQYSSNRNRCINYGVVGNGGMVEVWESCFAPEPSLVSKGKFWVGGERLQDSAGGMLLFFDHEHPVWLLTATDEEPEALNLSFDTNRVEMSRMLRAAGGSQLMIRASDWLTRVHEPKGVAAGVINGLASGILQSSMMVGVSLFTMMKKPYRKNDMWKPEVSHLSGPFFSEVIHRAILLRAVTWAGRQLLSNNGEDWPDTVAKAEVFGNTVTALIETLATLSRVGSGADRMMALVYGLTSALVYGPLYQRFGLESSVAAHVTNNLVLWITKMMVLSGR